VNARGALATLELEAQVNSRCGPVPTRFVYTTIAGVRLNRAERASVIQNAAGLAALGLRTLRPRPAKAGRVYFSDMPRVGLTRKIQGS
jgi:hypothetical protein